MLRFEVWKSCHSPPQPLQMARDFPTHSCRVPYSKYPRFTLKVTVQYPLYERLKKKKPLFFKGPFDIPNIWGSQVKACYKSGVSIEVTTAHNSFGYQKNQNPWVVSYPKSC